MAVNVYLIDDHPLVAEGFRAMISTREDIRFVGHADTGQRGLDFLQGGNTLPDVILLDIDLPDASGVDLCKEIHGKYPDVKIIILTASNDPENVFNTISAGASSFLLKDTPPTELLNAVRDAHVGKVALSGLAMEALMNKIQTGDANSETNRINSLSKQEKKVIALVSRGLTNKEIASELGLSNLTVKNYLSNLMDKLGVNRRAEAAAMFARSAGSRAISA